MVRRFLILLLAILLILAPFPGPARAATAAATAVDELVRLARAYGVDPYWVLAVATVETQDGLLITYNPDGSADVGRLQVNSQAVQALGFSNTTQGPVDWTAVTVAHLVDDPALALEAGVIMLRWWLHEALEELDVYHALDPELRGIRYTGRVWHALAEDLQDEALRLASAWYNGGPGSSSRTWYTLQVLSETRAWRAGRRTALPPLRAPAALGDNQQPVLVFLPVVLRGYNGEPVATVLASGCVYAKDPGLLANIAARRHLSLAGTRGAVSLADEVHLGKLVYLELPDGQGEGPYRVVDYWPGGWAAPPEDWAAGVDWLTWVHWQAQYGDDSGCVGELRVLWYPVPLAAELRAVGRTGLQED